MCSTIGDKNVRLNDQWFDHRIAATTRLQHKANPVGIEILAQTLTALPAKECKV
ncbi:hypothetical protein REIFOR_01387 [Reinekea forsetii]|uniref:Uncharacterized protein n=1 Tax=Reinekea forsetii TaxID=1336806 RepID=A0A2K8KP18_9GAMM|nr:hypothetical protein REIFOR_01387 [Reinekea forsetii]